MFSPEKAWSTVDVVRYLFTDILPDLSKSPHKGLFVNDTTAAHRHKSNEMQLELRGYRNYRVSSGTTGEIQPNVRFSSLVFYYCCDVLF